MAAAVLVCQCHSPSSGRLGKDEPLTHSLCKCILAWKLQSPGGVPRCGLENRGCGKGRYLVQLPHPHPEHLVLQIVGRRTKQLMDLKGYLKKGTLHLHFTLGPANCRVGPDSKVFICSPNFSSVLQMVYLPACLNIFTWIFKTFQIQQI